MKWLVLFLALLSGSLAAPKDLTRQAFIFPSLSNTAYVQLTPSLNKVLFNSTICLRFFSDESKELTLFSMATAAEPHSLSLFLLPDGNYKLFVAGKAVIFLAMPYKRNQWNSICATWESPVGLAQLWVNGVASPKKALHAGGSIADNPIIVLGQDQDAYGGKFNTVDAFVGHITDVHMWDYGLPPSQIQNYTDNIDFTPGNYLNWKVLEYIRYKYVLVERKLSNTEKEGSM